jgi:HEAT repeat protein
MAVKCAMPYLLGLLMDKNSGVHSAVISAIGQILMQGTISFLILAAIPFSTMLHAAALVTDIESAIPHVLDMLEVQDSCVCAAAISAITEFSKQCKIFLLVLVPILTPTIQLLSSLPSRVSFCEFLTC